MGYYPNTTFLNLEIPDWADVSKNDYASEVGLDQQLSSSLSIIDEFCAGIGTGSIGPPGPSGSAGPAGPSGSIGPAGPSVWGGITGDLYGQTDLSSSLTAVSASANLSQIAGHSLYVDNFRVDSYVENGSVAKPFKTIQAAIDSVTSPSATAPYTINVSAGSYTEDVTVDKPYVAIEGEGSWATFINGVFSITPDGSPWNTNISDVGFPVGSFTITGSNVSGANVPRVYLHDLRIAVPFVESEDSTAGSIITYAYDSMFTSTMLFEKGSSAWLYGCHGTSAAMTIDASPVQMYGGSTQATITLQGTDAYLMLEYVGEKVGGTNFNVVLLDSSNWVDVDSDTRSLMTVTNTGGGTVFVFPSSEAEKLSTARTINGVPFDGTANITISGSTTWGFISGSLYDQTDISSSLASKITTGSNITVSDAVDPAIQVLSAPGGTQYFKIGSTGGVTIKALVGNHLTIKDSTETYTPLAVGSAGELLIKAITGNHLTVKDSSGTYTLFSIDSAGKAVHTAVVGDPLTVKTYGGATLAYIDATGNLSASNVSGVNTGDQDLSNKANLSGSQTFVGGQRAAYTTLTNVAGTIAVDLSLNNNFVYTIAATGTLAAPTNAVAGQSGIFEISIDAGTLILDSFWKVPSGSDVTFTTTSGALDTLVYNVRSNGTSAICNLLKNIGG